MLLQKQYNFPLVFGLDFFGNLPFWTIWVGTIVQYVPNICYRFLYVIDLVGLEK